jgi:hypothetical protein
MKTTASLRALLVLLFGMTFAGCAANFINEIENAPNFPPCVNKTSDIPQPDPAAHPSLADHLRPGSILPTVEPYSILFYSCVKPANSNVNVSIKHYRLFTDTALKFAKQKPEYPVRILADTIQTPEFNCPRNYCPGDGINHHAPPSCSCLWCGAC